MELYERYIGQATTSIIPTCDVDVLYNMLFGQIERVDKILDRLDDFKDNFDLCNDDISINIDIIDDSIINNVVVERTSTYTDDISNIYEEIANLLNNNSDIQYNLITSNDRRYLSPNFRNDVVILYHSIIPTLSENIDVLNNNEYVDGNNSYKGICDIDMVSKKKTIDIKKYDEICVICMENKNNKMRETLCSHEYHDDCIRKWLKKSRKCPCCMTDLVILSTNKIKN